MKTQWLLAAAVVLVLGAEAKDDAKTDMKKIQGTWNVASMERGGEQVDLATEKGVPSKVVFEGNTVTVTVKDEVHKATFKLDPTKKPRTIDIIPSGGEEKGRVMKGVYRLKGDTLTICLNEKSNERPKQLATKKGSPASMVVFKRAKE